MEITLNNRKESFDQDQLTIQNLIDIKNFSFKMLVVKVNGKLVKKDEYQSFTVKAGDEVAIIHLISGG